MKFLKFFNNFLRRLTIGHKLIISYLLMGIIVLFVVYYFYYITTKNTIITRTHNQLNSVMNLKKGWLESYFENQKTHINHFATHYITQQIFDELDLSFKKYGIASRSYQQADSSVGRSIRQFELYDHFNDVWLMNVEGDIIFSSAKDGNIGKNIKDEIRSVWTFNQTFLRSVQSQTFSELDFHDKSMSKEIVVIVAPVKDSKSDILGYVLAKLNMDDVNKIMAQRSGLGKTGESYIVDDSFIMRSKSRFLEEKNSSQIVVTTVGVKLALGGKAGQGIILDYRGAKVLSCYTKINVPGLNWVLVSEIDYEEALQPVYELNYNMLVVGVLISIGLVIVTLYLSGKISNPIRNISLKINQLSKGVLPYENIKVYSEDEIGQITIAVNQLAEALQKTAAFAREIGSGNFTANFEPLSNQDILGLSLIEMRDQLAKLSNLVAEQNRIKTLSLIEGQENERRRISRELHDGVGQMLTAMMFKIQELDKSNPILQSTKKLLDETIQEVRRVSVNLVPSVLYDFGIEAAIKTLIKSVDLDIEFTLNRDLNAVEPDLVSRICLYRITQEAIQNIQKYAKTNRVRIHIELSHNAIDLVIIDYGKGFDVNLITENSLSSNGLRNMRERADLVGGTFEIESEKGKGTKITVNIPL